MVPNTYFKIVEFYQNSIKIAKIKDYYSIWIFKFSFGIHSIQFWNFPTSSWQLTVWRVILQGRNYIKSSFYDTSLNEKGHLIRLQKTARCVCAKNSFEIWFAWFNRCIKRDSHETWVQFEVSLEVDQSFSNSAMSLFMEAQGTQGNFDPRKI